MPPRRKRTAATASSGDGPTKTKIKKEPGTEESDDVTEIDGVPVRWEWEADGNKWTQYAAEHSKNLTEEYNSDAANMVFEVGGGAVKMKVVFGKMVQKNNKTGWERRIRCCCKDSASQEYYSWEWQEDGGSWAPYNAATTIKLEKAKLAGDSTVESSAGRTKYDIDLDKMQQTNPSTNVSRAVRREPSVAVADDTPAPVVKAPSRKSASAAKGAGDAPAAKGSSGQKGRSKGSKVKTEPGEDGEEMSVRTVTMKGAAPVDPECYAKVGVAHVFSEGKDIYDAMLNQTNLSNNNNKYYLMQILKDDNKKAFSVWFRWGRVGFGGQNNLIPCGPDLDQAKSIFCKKFQDKTKNNWSNRSKFSKVSGKYDLVKIDYNAKNDEKEEETAPEKPMNVPDSKLDQKLQDLINLICDVKSMEETVVEMKYDAKKAPLGKLTPDQIKAGYAALKKIDNCITNNNFGQRLVLACDEFYTRIPHCFGMQRPPVIRTKDVLKAKIQLLEALGDIEIAMKIIKESKSTENPVDTHYNSLHCGLTPLNKTDPDFKMVEDYLQNTHAKTHNQYKMKILDIFCCDKKGEASNFVDHGNRMLLWHGSRLTNWVGILSQGLRIAPPEAPVTGYMFGKGVYFADMSSKSANYCFASRSKKTGLVLLCEVALGAMNELLDADYNAAAMPKGKHSVKGMGAIAPDPAKNFVMPNKTVVPLGKPKTTGVTNPSGYTLNYNEYIVYSTKQIKMKYLLKVEFQFK